MHTTAGGNPNSPVWWCCFIKSRTYTFKTMNFLRMPATEILTALLNSLRKKRASRSGARLTSKNLISNQTPIFSKAHSFLGCGWFKGFGFSIWGYVDAFTEGVLFFSLFLIAPSKWYFCNKNKINRAVSCCFSRWLHLFSVWSFYVLMSQTKEQSGSNSSSYPLKKKKKFANKGYSEFEDCSLQ